MKERFDAIVVGAGSAGSVVVRRLIDAGRRVLLLEAGGEDLNSAIHDMSLAGSLWHGPEDWDYYTTPQVHADGRRLHLPRGKVLGGSHSLNGSIWVRGAASDFDGWAEDGCAGWSWDDVLPVYETIENYDGGVGNTRGVGGPVEVVGGYELTAIQQSILDASVEAGLPFNPDYNGGALDGVSQQQINVRDGKRQSTYTAYVRPVQDSPLLEVRTGAWAHRVLFDGHRAVGVEYETADSIQRVHTDTVVLAAGALDSPRILLLSGVGPADELRAVGIDVIANLQGVGKNLHDHFLSPVIFTTTKRTVDPSPSGSSQSQTHHFWRSRPGLTEPDTQPLNFSVPMYQPGMSGPEKGFTLMAGLVTPYSRGALTLTAADPHLPANIDLNALHDRRDVDALAASVALCREIGRQAALAEWGAVELYPGPAVEDARLDEYVRRTVVTYHHQVGTCRMGVDDLAVVDPTLRVRGLDGLYVVDASVMPRVTTANTNAPTILIGEKGARLLLDRS